MEEEKIRAWNIGKKLFRFFGTLLVLYLCLRFATYFMPFFIAGLIALIVEPIIKFNMNKLRMSRRMSSLIVVVVTVVIIIGLAIWGGAVAGTKLVELSKSLPSLITNATANIQSIINKYAEEYGEYFTPEMADSISTTVTSVISSLGGYIEAGLTKGLQVVLSVPRMIVNVIITILAFVFFTKDRVYIIDLLEYHVPEKWLNKAIFVKNEVFTTIGSYLKIYSKILLITFLELLVSFWILNKVGFEIPHIVRLSVIIAIIDILPILGVGTVLIPWFIWSFICGNVGLGIGLLIVYIVILIIRQIIEPKLVSDQLGVHPIITLLAMWAGLKMVGFSGLILGPIALMILRCIYAEQIKKGLLKSLVE